MSLVSQVNCTCANLERGGWASHTIRCCSLMWTNLRGVTSLCILGTSCRRYCRQVFQERGSRQPHFLRGTSKCSCSLLLCARRCALEWGGLPCRGCHLGRPKSASGWAFFRQSCKGSCQGAQHSSLQCCHCRMHAGGIADGNPPLLRQGTEWRLPCSLIDHQLSVTARPRCGVRQASKLRLMHCPQFTLAVGLTGQVSLSKVLFLEQGTLRTPSLATVTPCARPTSKVRLHALYHSSLTPCRLYLCRGTL